ncbi:MAG: Mrp/NBP35 family ATP-binding protein [Bacteroidales bacterium]|nr:Mrp/NBP35 family ATP-binding protein [Bacteroidales bacterium]
MNPFEEKKKREEAIQKAMSSIKHIIAVGSGKGGVGKSTVAANLAISLASKGYKVGLADADVYGPSIPTLFNIDKAEILAMEKDGKDWMLPVERLGVKLMSIGFMVDTQSALIWRGPMAANALTQLLSETYWGELDYLVLDMPPGTGDIQLTLVQTFHTTGSIFVCTPQQLAVADVRRAINMFDHDDIKVPILGLVENMAYFTPKELPNNKYYIFGKDGGKGLAQELNIDFLGEIPISCSISESNDKGTPIASNYDTPECQAFLALADKIIEKTK